MKSQILFSSMVVLLISVILIAGCGRMNVPVDDRVTISPGAEIPIPAGDCSVDSDCVRGGCSGHVCSPKSDEPMMTTCEWKEEYACYRIAECGCAEGKCGWKSNEAFENCMKSSAGSEPPAVD